MLNSERSENANAHVRKGEREYHELRVCVWESHFMTNSGTYNAIAF